jgi:hypothetical protein
MTNGSPVTRDLFDATQRENDRRLGNAEHELEGLRGAEQEHEALSARITALESAGKSEAGAEASRRERTWALVMIFIGSLVLPLLTTAVIAFLHLKSYH